MLEIEATLYISLDVHTEILFYWRLNKYISGGLENILFGISINTEQILLWTEKGDIITVSLVRHCLNFPSTCELGQNLVWELLSSRCDESSLRIHILLMVTSCSLVVMSGVVETRQPMQISL